MFSISIVIVSWNVSALLLDCLSSIFASPTGALSEVIVVDSASADDTVSLVQQRFPQVRLIALSENVGFARANNIGLAAASGDFILLLNPDTRILGDAIGDLARYLRHHPDVGIVGPHTLNQDGTHQSTRRRFPTVLTGIFESTWFQSYAPRSVLEHYYVLDASDDADAVQVDWVQGSALMLRRVVYEQVGGLDEGYFMYSEELDFCKRARARGWDVVYLGQVYLVHLGGKSAQQVHFASQVAFHKSKIRYFYKHHGKFAAFLVRLFIFISYIINILFEFLKFVVGHKRSLRRYRLSVYIRVLSSGAFSF